MGMSTHVVGIKPPDQAWKAMKSAWDACVAAKVSVPIEVLNFFGHEIPDAAGVVVDLEKTEAVEQYNTDSVQGFEVRIDKLPKDVKVVRFYNSY